MVLTHGLMETPTRLLTIQQHLLLLGGAANGCDSIVTLDLTISNSVSGTDTQTACGSYTWIDGNTYTASNNTATFNIPRRCSKWL